MLVLTLVPNLHLIDEKNLLRLSFKSDLWYSLNLELKYSPNMATLFLPLATCLPSLWCQATSVSFGRTL